MDCKVHRVVCPFALMLHGKFQCCSPSALECDRIRHPEENMAVVFEAPYPDITEPVYPVVEELSLEDIKKLIELEEGKPDEAGKKTKKKPAKKKAVQKGRKPSTGKRRKGM